MPSIKLKSYHWQAQDLHSQKQRGMIIAENVQQAKIELMARQLQHIKLQQNWQLSSKPRKAELSELLNQLACLLQAKIPLKACLQILLEGCVQIGLNQWLRQLILSLDSGLSFSQAIEFQGLYLSSQEQQLIIVGEMTGKLEQICTQIAQHRQQALHLQRKLQKILLYPLLVLIISISLSILLLLFVVPQFAEMYDSNQAQLPTFTAILLYLSNVLRNHFIVIFAILISLSAFLRWQFRHSLRIQRYKTQLIAHIPLVNKLIQLGRLVNFSQSLQIMLQSGVPLKQALQSFLPQQKSWQIRPTRQSDWALITQVEQMLTYIEQGYPLSHCLSSEFFPIQAQQMLRIGEQSGQLSTMLRHIANNYRQRLEHQIDLLSQLLEPVLMLIIGSLIGIIMLGMYLPIFNMGSIIQ